MHRIALLLLSALAVGAGAQLDSAPFPDRATATDSVYAHARQLVLEGNGPAGRALVDSIVRATDPGSPAFADALFWRATLAATAAEAERDYRRIIVEYGVTPRASGALLALAQLEMSRGDRAGAIEHLDRYMLENPAREERGRAGLWLARLLIEQGRLARGCTVLGRARAAIAADAVELRNQLDFYGQRCVGVDTVEAPVRVAAAPARARYSVQVAAYDSRADAEALAKRLRTRGLEARVSGTARPFRVRIGRYATRGEANALLARLRAEGTTGYVTTAEPEGGAR